MTTDIKKINYFEFIMDKEGGKSSKFVIMTNLLYFTNDYSPYDSEKFDEQKIIDEDALKLLLETVNSLQLKKWKKRYTNYKIKNSKDWSLSIAYNDRITPKHFYGSNEYPLIYETAPGLKPFSSTSYTKEFKILIKNLNKISGKRSLFK